MTVVYVDLLSREFEWGGRGPKTYDCYGLVRELYHRAGTEIPNYPTSLDGPINVRTMIRAAETGWEKLAAAEPGCAVTFIVDGQCHIGYVIDSFHFIHIMEKIRVCKEKLSSPLWRNCITGFYHWKGTSDDPNL